MPDRDRLESAALALLHSTTSITGTITQKAIDAAVEGAQLLQAKFDALDVEAEKARHEESAIAQTIIDAIQKRADSLELLILSEFIAMGIEFGEGTVKRLADAIKATLPAPAAPVPAETAKSAPTPPPADTAIATAAPTTSAESTPKA